MKIRPFILRCTAFFLILVFSQKAGTGLFIHDLFHTNNTSSLSHPGKENKQSNEINYTCSCIDDFLMPFIEAEEPVYFQNISIPITPLTFFKVEIPFRSVIHSSLRGPPAYTL